MRIPYEELQTTLENLLQQPDVATRLPALLEEIQPYDLAELLSRVSDESARFVLTLLEPALAAEILGHMEYIAQYRLLHNMERAAAQRILEQMSSDEVVDLVQAIHPRQAHRLLGLLPPAYGTAIRSLTQYPENSAGGRMTIDYISVRQYMSVEQVLDHIQKVGHEAETIQYIYVVDGAGRLVGVLSLRDLILASRKKRIADVMNTNAVSVPVTMDQKDVARVVSQYDLVAVPVVSGENHLLGIITVDDVLDVIQEEASEDVYRMGATSAPEEGLLNRSLLQSVWALARPRLPWLVGLLFLEMGSSFIVDSFSGLVTPATAVLLALFTVVMAGESGNAATQALAIVVRGLATGEIQPKDMPRIVLREALVGIVVGLITGTTLMLVGWFWHDSLVFGFAIGLALFTNLFIAKVLGGLFPVLIHRMGIDPAVASGPFITTFTDNTSMLVYYGIAAIVLKNFGA